MFYNSSVFSVLFVYDQMFFALWSLSSSSGPCLTPVLCWPVIICEFSVVFILSSTDIHCLFFLRVLCPRHFFLFAVALCAIGSKVAKLAEHSTGIDKVMSLNVVQSSLNSIFSTELGFFSQLEFSHNCVYKSCFLIFLRISFSRCSLVAKNKSVGWVCGVVSLSLRSQSCIFVLFFVLLVPQMLICFSEHHVMGFSDS